MRIQHRAAVRANGCWHRWFAWYPVTVYVESAPDKPRVYWTVWMEHVERKVLAYSGYDGTRYEKDYRMVEPSWDGKAWP